LLEFIVHGLQFQGIDSICPSPVEVAGSYPTAGYGGEYVNVFETRTPVELMMIAHVDENIVFSYFNMPSLYLV
jgi:hypothetical protein